MADLVEALGKDVLKEATHELSSGKSHGPPSVLLGVFVAEGHVAILEGEDTVVRDCDTVDVAGKIRKDLVSALCGRFAIDNPIGLPDGLREGDIREGLSCQGHELARKILDSAATGTR